MNKTGKWVIAVATTAAAGYLALQNGLAPQEELPPLTGNTPPVATETAPPTDTPTYEYCAFMWATHEDPELTIRLDETVKTIDPQASADASLFGEDCVYADGHVTFSTMETDFHVRIPVNDLTTTSIIGDRMKQVMEVIIALPDEEVQGNPGFVEFTFFKSDTERIIMRVAIPDYQNLEPGTAGADLFNRFYTPPPPRVTYPPPTPTPTP